MAKMRYVVALDIGGTKIEGILFNEKYKILKKKRIYFGKKKSESTVNLPKKKVLEQISSIITDLKSDHIISGIGICIPDIITQEGSISGSSKINALSNFALGGYLKKKFKCKVKVVNDADAFALGEQRLGAGKGYKNVIGVIFGTGIGSGIIINGNIYSGTTGSAGEIGFSIVDPSGPKDRKGFIGTVESFSGGPDMVRNYISFGGKMKDADPKKIYKSKERAAKKAMALNLEKLSVGLAQLMNILNPGIIVIGGGQSNLPVYRELNRITKKYTVDGLRKYVKIVKNKLGDSAGIYGAATLAFEG